MINYITLKMEENENISERNERGVPKSLKRGRRLLRRSVARVIAPSLRSVVEKGVRQKPLNAGKKKKKRRNA